MAVNLKVCLFLYISLAVMSVQGEKSKNWAVLVATSNSFDNYGQQADVFAAYQALRQGGVPEEQIIVMAYNDVVQDKKNPFPGKVFQSYDLQDIYKGVTIDYSKAEVTKDTFLSVLQGDKDAVKKLTGRDGKVLESGPEDNVFVLIDNHGYVGHVAWHDSNDLSATELNNAILSMHENKRYKHLAVYIDACFSGSMFENILPDNIGVYAATASNATYFAFSTDCRSAAFQGPSRTCLGGLFSINWVYQLRSDERSTTSMRTQFEQTKIASDPSCIPMQYGNLSIADFPQQDFFGDSALNQTPWQGKARFSHRRTRRVARGMFAVPKHRLEYESRKIRLQGMPENSLDFERVTSELNQIENLMGQADQLFKNIASAVYGRFLTNENLARAETNFGPINWSCYEPVVEAVKEECPRMVRTEGVRYYALAKFGVLVNLCNEVATSTVLAAIRAAAKTSPLCGL